MKQLKALAHRWFEEVWNERRDDTIFELAAENAVGHLESGVEINSADVFKGFRDNLLAALPDMKVKIEEVMAEGDSTVVRWSFVGNHRGDGFGFKPTGREIHARGLTWFRFEDGKIIEAWDSWNQSAMFQQMIGDDPATGVAYRAT